MTCTQNCDQGRVCSCCGGECPTPQACELPERDGTRKVVVAVLLIAVIGAIVHIVT